jgi:CRP-like cAMP-binding protein
VRVEDFDDFFGPEHANPDAAAISAENGIVDGDLPVPPRLGLLKSLTVEQFDLVARAAKLQFTDDGHVVFHQGDEGDRFFILMEGMVEVIKDGAVVACLEPGSFFGEASLLTGEPRSADVRSVGKAVLWSVDRHAFEAAVGRTLLNDPAAVEEIQRRMGRVAADEDRAIH